MGTIFIAFWFVKFSISSTGKASNEVEWGEVSEVDRFKYLGTTEG